MFFYLAKVVWFVLQPSTLIALLIGYGAILIWTGWARWGRRFVSIGAALLLIVGLSPLGNALILPLEDRFPRANLVPPPEGIIILGGGESRLIGQARKAPTLNEAGERLLEGALLAMRFPQTKVAFSGGDAGILYKADSEAAGAAALLGALGVSQDRLILEANARDTYENAVYLKKELEAKGTLEEATGGRWFLVTSAYHMPRSIGAFRQAGFDVEPWPVDYRTRGSEDLKRPFFQVSEGLRRVDTAAREWVGLLAYWLTGRSSALFPAPEETD